MKKLLILSLISVQLFACSALWAGTYKVRVTIGQGEKQFDATVTDKGDKYEISVPDRNISFEIGFSAEKIANNLTELADKYNSQPTTAQGLRTAAEEVAKLSGTLTAEKTKQFTEFALNNIKTLNYTYTDNSRGIPISIPLRIDNFGATGTADPLALLSQIGNIVGKQITIPIAQSPPPANQQTQTPQQKYEAARERSVAANKAAREMFKERIPENCLSEDTLRHIANSAPTINGVPIQGFYSAGKQYVRVGNSGDFVITSKVDVGNFNASKDAKGEIAGGFPQIAINAAKTPEQRSADEAVRTTYADLKPGVGSQGETGTLGGTAGGGAGDTGSTGDTTGGGTGTGTGDSGVGGTGTVGATGVGGTTTGGGLTDAEKTELASLREEKRTLEEKKAGLQGQITNTSDIKQIIHIRKNDGTRYKPEELTETVRGLIDELQKYPMRTIGGKYGELYSKLKKAVEDIPGYVKGDISPIEAPYAPKSSDLDELNAGVKGEINKIDDRIKEIDDRIKTLNEKAGDTGTVPKLPPEPPPDTITPPPPPPDTITPAPVRPDDTEAKRLKGILVDAQGELKTANDAVKEKNKTYSEKKAARAALDSEIAKADEERAPLNATLKAATTARDNVKAAVDPKIKDEQANLKNVTDLHSAYTRAYMAVQPGTGDPGSKEKMDTYNAAYNEYVTALQTYGDEKDIQGRINNLNEKINAEERMVEAAQKALDKVNEKYAPLDGRVNEADRAVETARGELNGAKRDLKDAKEKADGALRDFNIENDKLGEYKLLLPEILTSTEDTTPVPGADVPELLVNRPVPELLRQDRVPLTGDVSADNKVLEAFVSALKGTVDGATGGLAGALAGYLSGLDDPDKAKKYDAVIAGIKNTVKGMEKVLGADNVKNILDAVDRINAVVQHKAAKDKAGKLEDEKKTLKKAAEDAKSAESGPTTKLNEKRTAREQAAEDKKTKEKTATDKRKEAGEKRTSATTARAGADAAETALPGLKTAKENAEAQLTTLNEKKLKRGEYSGKIADETTNMATHSAARDEANRKVTAATAEITRLNTKLGEKNTALTDARTRKSGLEADKTRLNGEITALETRVSAYSGNAARLTEKTGKRDEKKTQRTAKNGEIARTVANKIQLNNDASKLATLITGLETSAASINNKKNERSGLETQKTQKTTEKGNVDNDINNLNTNITNLQGTKQAREAELPTAQQTFNDKKKAHDDLVAEAAAAQKAVDDYIAAGNTESTVSNYRNILGNNEHKVQQAQTAFDAAQTAVTTAQGTVTSLENSLPGQLAANLTNAQNDLTSKRNALTAVGNIVNAIVERDNKQTAYNNATWDTGRLSTAKYRKQQNLTTARNNLANAQSAPPQKSETNRSLSGNKFHVDYPGYGGGISGTKFEPPNNTTTPSRKLVINPSGATYVYDYTYDANGRVTRETKKYYDRSGTPDAYGKRGNQRSETTTTYTYPNVSSLQSAVDTAQRELDTAKANLQTAQTTEQNALTELNNANTILNQAGGAGMTLGAANTAKTAAQTLVSQAETRVSLAQYAKDHPEENAQLKQARANLATAQGVLETKRDDLESKKKTRDRIKEALRVAEGGGNKYNEAKAKLNPTGEFQRNLQAALQQKNDANAEVNRINTAISTAETDIAAARTTLAAKQTRSGQLETEINTLNTSIGALTSEINDLNGRAVNADLASRLATERERQRVLLDRIANYDANEVDPLRAELAALDGEIAALDTEIAGLTAAMTPEDAAAATNLENKRGELKTVKDQLDGYDSREIDPLQREVDAINGDITTQEGIKTTEEGKAQTADTAYKEAEARKNSTQTSLDALPSDEQIEADKTAANRAISDYNDAVTESNRLDGEADNAESAADQAEAAAATAEREASDARTALTEASKAEGNAARELGNAEEKTKAAEKARDKKSEELEAANNQLAAIAIPDADKDIDPSALTSLATDLLNNINAAVDQAVQNARNKAADLAANKPKDETPAAGKRGPDEFCYENLKKLPRTQIGDHTYGYEVLPEDYYDSFSNNPSAGYSVGLWGPITLPDTNQRVKGIQVEYVGDKIFVWDREIGPDLPVTADTSPKYSSPPRNSDYDYQTLTAGNKTFQEKYGDKKAYDQRRDDGLIALRTSEGDRGEKIVEEYGYSETGERTTIKGATYDKNGKKTAESIRYSDAGGEWWTSNKGATSYEVVIDYFDDGIEVKYKRHDGTGEHQLGRISYDNSGKETSRWAPEGSDIFGAQPPEGTPGLLLMQDTGGPDETPTPTPPPETPQPPPVTPQPPPVTPQPPPETPQPPPETPQPPPITPQPPPETPQPPPEQPMPDTILMQDTGTPDETPTPQPPPVTPQPPPETPYTGPDVAIETDRPDKELQPEQPMPDTILMQDTGTPDETPTPQPPPVTPQPPPETPYTGPGVAIETDRPDKEPPSEQPMPDTMLMQATGGPDGTPAAPDDSQVVPEQPIADIEVPQEQPLIVPQPPPAPSVDTTPPAQIARDIEVDAQGHVLKREVTVNEWNGTEYAPAEKQVIKNKGPFTNGTPAWTNIETHKYSPEMTSSPEMPSYVFASNTRFTNTKVDDKGHILEQEVKKEVMVAGKLVVIETRTIKNFGFEKDGTPSMTHEQGKTFDPNTGAVTSDYIKDMVTGHDAQGNPVSQVTKTGVWDGKKYEPQETQTVKLGTAHRQMAADETAQLKPQFTPQPLAAKDAGDGEVVDEYYKKGDTIKIGEKGREVPAPDSWVGLPKNSHKMVENADGEKVRVDIDNISYKKDEKGEIKREGYTEKHSVDGKEIKSVVKADIKYKDGKENSWAEVTTQKKDEKVPVTQTMSIVKDGKPLASATYERDKDGKESFSGNKDMQGALKEVRKSAEKGGGISGGLSAAAHKTLEKGLTRLQEVASKIEQSARDSTSNLDKLVGDAKAVDKMKADQKKATEGIKTEGTLGGPGKIEDKRK